LRTPPFFFHGRRNLAGREILDVFLPHSFRPINLFPLTVPVSVPGASKFRTDPLLSTKSPGLNLNPVKEVASKTKEHHGHHPKNQYIHAHAVMSRVDEKRAHRVDSIGKRVKASDPLEHTRRPLEGKKRARKKKERHDHKINDELKSLEVRFANNNAESRPSDAFLCSNTSRSKSGFDLKS
jgi:hypothetical protein